MVLTRQTVITLLVALAIIACVVLLSIDTSDAVSLAGIRKGG
jgi:hypothetical protein